MHILAHGKTFCKVSNQFDQRCGRSCGDNVGVSNGHNSIKNGKNKIKIPHAHLNIIRKHSTKFQINPTKDVGVVAETRFRTNGRTHTRTDKGHFYICPLPMLGGNKSIILMLAFDRVNMVLWGIWT